MFFNHEYYKILEKPIVYQINLLKPSNWVYVSIYYKAGYIFENKTNNLSHIFEHYLVNLLIERGIPVESIRAYTDEEFIEIDFRFHRQDLLKNLKILIDNLAALDVSRQDILNREKDIVYNEVNEKNNNMEMRHRFLIEKQLLNKDCPYLKAHDYSQASLIKNIGIEDLKRFYNSKVKLTMPIICFGGYNITKEKICKIKSIISRAKWNYKNKKISFPRCKMMTKQIKDIQDEYLNNGIYLYFISPLSVNKQMDIIKRKAIRVLLEDFHNHSPYYSLNTLLREIGIYKSNLKIYLFQNWGYFYYSIFGSRDNILTITRVFKKATENWKKKEIFGPIIKDSIKDICSQRNTDYDNEARFYNFSDALAQDIKPFNDEQYIKSLDALRSTFWRNLTNCLFNNKMNIFIIHNNPKKINLKKIRNIFFKK